ncbi:MAG TPA: LD-carboxypeptidase [Vicinamibacteria bacterium]|nr:LD-carboxypeptidase [Vicinamibacteria bacterium]
MSWTKPRALRPGDLLGVAAPSAAFDPALLARGVAELESLGFRVRVPDGIHERARFAAGTAARRLAELAALYEDDAVAGIVCARGGAGSIHLLPAFDPGLAQKHPKPLIGCSDLTFLHVVLNGLGLVTFHGPMAAGDIGRGTYDRDSFWRAVTGEGGPWATDDDDLLVLRSGQGRGRLLGGCLSILASGFGTPWAFHPDRDGTILFLEDVGEPPYRIDRHLRQLRAAGAFEGLRGVVFGDMPGCAPPRDVSFTLEEVILDALAGLDVPVALGLSSGHVANGALTLPLGVPARLSCDGAARLELLETGVR